MSIVEAPAAFDAGMIGFRIFATALVNGQPHGASKIPLCLYVWVMIRAEKYLSKTRD